MLESQSLRSHPTVSFTKLFAEHIEAHTAGLKYIHKFRSLETRLERARTDNTRAEIIKDIESHWGVRQKSITSVSLFDEDVLLANDYLARGRNFVRMNAPGSPIEMIQFEADVLVSEGLRNAPKAYPHTYVIGICAAPEGKTCRGAGGAVFEPGEVVTFFPACGPFVVRYPSIKRIRQKYLEKRDDVTGYHMVRALCE